jgi:hypothetical protein
MPVDIQSNRGASKSIQHWMKIETILPARLKIADAVPRKEPNGPFFAQSRRSKSDWLQARGSPPRRLQQIAA